MKISVKQYAEALFETCQTNNNLGKVIIDFEEVIVRKNSFSDYLQNGSVSKINKYQKLVATGLEKNSINFLFLLTKNKCFNKLEIILFYLKEMRNNKDNILEVKVESSRKLDEQEQKYIISKIKEKTTKEILFSVKINSEILGGIIIKIGETIIDNSLKNKLNILQKELSK